MPSEEHAQEHVHAAGRYHAFWLRRGGLGAGLAAVLLAGGACSRRSMVVDPFPPVSTVQIDQRLTPDEVRADLEEMFDLIEATTPAPYLRVRREVVRAEFDRLKSEIGRPMSRREVVGVFEEAYASYGIGHLYVLVPYEDFNTWADRGGRVLSVALRVEAPDADSPTRRRLVVRQAHGELDEGAEIVRINGIEVDALLATLARRTSAETEAYRTLQMSTGLHSGLWGLGLEAPYTLTAADGRSVVDAGRVPERRVSLFARRDAPAGGVPARTDFAFRWVEPDIALIRWTAMDPRRSQEWEAFLARSFREIRDRPAAGVIVDLRDNGGGSSQLARALLGHFSEVPVRFAGGKLWRKSAAYDRFLESAVVWWARGLPWRQGFSNVYAGMKVGEEREVGGSKPQAVPRREPFFDGPVAVLIGPATFSSAAMFADAIATYDVAPLIGQPTGGVPTSHGEIGFHRLSRSRIVVSFCSALFLRASGDRTDPGPVRPTITSAGIATREGQRVDHDVETATQWIRTPHLPRSRP